jgi:DNA mismatch repair protein MutS
MMRQYLEVKAAHPECLLLMRMGDFYEAFLDDAAELSRVAGVALTSRNKDSDQPIAMAGVPHHSLQTHLPKLLAAGKQVAIMDQLEDPKEAKGLVKRGLTRVITAGTLIDESGLEAASANWLVALTGLDGVIGIAALDVSTGRFTVEEASTAQQLGLALARLQPAELLLPSELRQADGSVGRLAALVAPAALPPLAGLPAYAWKGADARRWLCERLRVASLDGFGLAADDDHLAGAAAAALRYAESSTSPGGDAGAGDTPRAGRLGHVRIITRLHQARHLIIDATCRRNLDLLRNSRDGGRAGTLLAAIDRTRTAPGARLLADWLSRPLAEREPIAARHDAVAALVADDRLRADLREALAEVYDLERLLARVATGRCNARDLVHLASSLRAAGVVRAALLARAAGAPAARATSHALPALLELAAGSLAPDGELVGLIASTLVDDPPLAISDGDLVRDGVDAELDQLRAIKRDAGAWLAAYQVREAEACGLAKLKVGYNKVFGYYIEISKANGDKVPTHFIRKQTLVGAERYITPELKEYEDRALGAEDRIRAAELAIFTRLRERTEQALALLQGCADALSLCDVVAGLAEAARKQGWCRPAIDDGLSLELADCRHPVVEEVVGRGRFVANDCHLDAGQPSGSPEDRKPGSSVGSHEAPGPVEPAKLAVITGPNMAGKSTYIRQVALAVVLAQAGSFVPAASARVGLVDRVFTRVGAGDELARNLSTFMVEMAETAAILNHATRRSLVILDEVGRGTSTFDGVSLAWAITEHLHDRIGCRCLFATHYHELVDLAADRPGIRNLTVSVAEQDDEVVFLHRIVPGAATKSYGIHVARLAGVPRPVIARAREVLATLEQLNVSLTERERPAVRAIEATGRAAPIQLTLFSAVESPTLQRLKTGNFDELSPRQALDLLYQLQAAARAE